MSAPKVFVSSTCYDLKIVRQGIEGFIKSYGYDAILSENHNVTYGTENTLEEDCYKEIKSCDILIGLVGGNFGSESIVKEGKSISMLEMQNAINENKQVYIFIERNVHTEYSTYTRNKGKTGIDWNYVDNILIYEYIEELKAARDIIINDFSSVDDITNCLKNQWAGLFQNFLYTKEQQQQMEGLLTIKKVTADLVKAADELRINTTTITETTDRIYLSSGITNVTVNPAFNKIADVLIGKDHPFILFYTRSQVINFIQALEFRQESEDTFVYAFDENQILKIDFNFFIGKNGKMMYKSVKEIEQYFVEEGHDFIYLALKNYSEEFLDVDDDDLPF